MGELGEVVPPLKISPQGPVETGRRAGDPGPSQPESRVGRRAGVELPAVTRRRRPSLPAAVRGSSPVRVERVALLPLVRAAYRRALPPTVVALPGPGARPGHGMDGDPGRRFGSVRATGRGADGRGHGRGHRRRPLAAAGPPAGPGR